MGVLGKRFIGFSSAAHQYEGGVRRFRLLGRIPSDDAALRRCADGNSES